MSGANGRLKLNHMGLGSGDWYVRSPPLGITETQVRVSF